MVVVQVVKCVRDHVELPEAMERFADHGGYQASEIQHDGEVVDGSAVMLAVGDDDDDGRENADAGEGEYAAWH